MSEQGESSADEAKTPNDESQSPEDIVKESTDMLHEHATSALEASKKTMRQSLEGNKLIESVIVAPSGTNDEGSEQHSSGYKGHSGPGLSGESSVGPRGEPHAGGGGHPGTRPGHAGPSNTGGAAGGDRSTQAESRSQGEHAGEPKHARTSYTLQTIMNTATGFLTPDRGELVDRVDLAGEKEDAKHTEEDRQKRLIDLFGGASSSGASSSGERKKPETLATHRWKKAYEFVKKNNAMKKKALSSPIGTGATLHGYSLGFMSIKNETRTTLFACLYNERTEYMLLGIILSHLFILILKAEDKWVTSFRPSKYSLDVADIILTSLYTAEGAARIVTLGFYYEGPHTYLRNSYNRLDLVIIIDSWVHIARTIILSKDAWLRLAVLRGFRGLLILRHYGFIGNVLAIIDAIQKSIGTLETVIIFTIILLSFYALLGVHYFVGNLHLRCLRESDGEVTYPELHCNLVPNQYMPDIQFDSCPFSQGLICKEIGNPNYGASSFDNFAASFLLIFQILTFEGWALLMYRVKNSSESGGTEAYFVVLVIVGSYFLVNIFVAAISGVFLRVRQEHQLLLRKYRREKAFSFANAITMANLLKDVILSDDAKLNWRQRFRRRTIKLSNKFSHALSRQSTKLRKSLSKAVDWNDPNSYLKRLSSFGLVGTEGLVEPEDPTLPRSFSRTMSRTLSRGASFGRSLSRQLSATTLAAAHHVSTKCWIIVHSKMFRFAVLFFISLNMAGLCSLKAKMTHQHESSIQSLEISMIIIFAAELVVRFLAAGLAGFIDERMNVIDLLVVFVSCGATGPKRKYPNLTPIRMLRWFYVKKSRRIDKEGQGTPILASILRSVGALSSVYFFLLMVIIIFSVFSMELYGGQMYNFDDGYPRANHDSFLQTMLLWFSVTTGESWVNHMWNAMRPGVKNRWFAPFLFVLYYMITAYVILNLIIATILEETELTDNQKKHIQKREHLKWLQTKHLQHMSSTRGSDWLLATVSGAHKGYKDVKRRMTSMRVSRMSLFPSRQTSEFQGSPPQTTAEGTSSSAESRPPAAVTPTEASSSRTFPPSRGLSTKRASFTTSDLPGSTDADDRTKARIFRRSSASALSTIAPATVHTPLHRRMSQESDKVLQRSGFTGGDFGGENRTVLQAALLAVVDDQAKVAAASVARDADEKIKAKAIAAGTGTYGRTKSGRTSFVLSDFEGIEAAEEKQDPWWMNRRSLFLFVPNNKMRLFITKVVDHPWYRWWQVLFCGCGTFVMASTDSIGNYYFFGPALPTLDKLTMAVFTLDVVLKSIAYGFLFTREAYLGDPYNFIDLLNLVMHGMYLTKYRHELPKNVFNKGKQIWLRTWRIMLAFRPFRFISRFRGLRTLTTSLIHTMPAIGQIFLFTVIVYAIYAVIGMQLYANRFRFCTDTTVIGHVDCVGLYHNEVGILMSRTWVNAPFHFDAFGEAMLALFVASTSDNWLEYFLYTSMDLAHHPELSPRRNISPSHALYFVSFICIGGFFILRMFVGVFIDQFGIISGTKLLTERQKLWRDTNRLIQSLRPKRLPAEVHGPIRGTCHNIVHSRAFELGVVAVICGNYIYIATVHYRQSLTLDQHNAIETAFVSVYLMEAILKFIGTKTADWWDDKWNVSELIMVLVSATVLWPTRYPKHVLSMHKVAGFFIIVRIFRVIRYFHTLNTMVKTVLVSLPSMVNIISLMGIFLACLAQVAQQTFPAIRDGICIHSRGENSFEDFAASFIVLLQVTTLDNWSCIMIDITIQPPDCVPGLSTVENDCGYPVGGLVYMLIAVCLTNYIFANLFIAQILDSITFGLLSENALLTPANLIAYQNLWSQKAFDSKCTGYLGQHKLKEFLVKLGSPLGGRKLIGFVKWYTKIEFEVFHFRSDKGIAFQPLLETICLYKVGPRGLELPIRIERERQIKSIYEKGAAIKIQGLVRGFLQRRRNKRAKAGGMEKDEGGKRYSENPDKPPDIVFGEDPLQARSGVARPHPRSQPLPTETGTPSNDGDRTPEQSSTSHASKPHESPSHSEIVPEIVPDTP